MGEMFGDCIEVLLRKREKLLLDWLVFGAGVLGPI